MANHLKVAKVLSIKALHAQGWSQRRIARELGIDRGTVARHLKTESKAAKAPPGSADSKTAKAPTGSEASGTDSKPATFEKAPTGSRSLCVPFKEVIVQGVDQGSEQDSDTKTRKASCRCGKLSVTYKGTDPERITMCHCNSCQLRTGTVFSVQGRFSREKVKIEGESTKWTVSAASEKEICDRGGATYHFCPVCGTTVYWDIAAAPDVIGIAVGTLFDPTFPPPKISGFEKHGHPWSMKAADLPIIRLELAEDK